MSTEGTAESTAATGRSRRRRTAFSDGTRAAMR
jgi:hypothetical protein